MSEKRKGRNYQNNICGRFGTEGRTSENPPCKRPVFCVLLFVYLCVLLYLVEHDNSKQVCD